MTPERARQIALACADSWYGGAAGMNLKEAIFQGIIEACKETEGDLVATRAERNAYRSNFQVVAWQLISSAGITETWIRMTPPIDDTQEWRPLYALKDGT